MILDGLGYGKHDKSNAVEAANTPFLDHLLEAYPNSSLEASGEAVGLPAGQMGNSEVGHMNLGAGRIVYQELGRIHKAVNVAYSIRILLFKTHLNMHWKITKRYI